MPPGRGRWKSAIIVCCSGEILEIHAAEEAFDAAGQMQAKGFDPLVYLGGIREYWSLGEAVGVAYRDGLSLHAAGKKKEAGTREGRSGRYVLDSATGNRDIG